MGDGLQTRSFLYIDECIEAVRRLMESSFQGPVNIGSEEMVTINQMAEMIMKIAAKKLAIKHIQDRPACGAETPTTNCRQGARVGAWSEPLRRPVKDLSVIHGQMQAASKKIPEVTAGAR